jgi:hemerythrin-like domain-containing protein
MSQSPVPPRRALIGLAASALVMPAACKRPHPAPADPKDIGSVEDLMREHGVLRRVLRIYDQLSDRLRAGDERFDAAALAAAAQLFREFGEDYHERMLEEAFLFPRIRQAGGRAGALADVLQAQHERGREITDYIVGATKGGSLATGAAAPLGQALRAMVVMYENHAAREDTIVFPAWKAALSPGELTEAGDKFEDIEKRMFGGDGFGQAERKASQIEQRLGYADLARFTAPLPPGASALA